MDGSGDDIFIGVAGEPRVVWGATIFSGSDVLAELATRAGFDTIWIEMEHGPTDFRLAQSLCQAVEAGGGFPAIRVCNNSRAEVLRALEVGARIVLVPMVNNAGQAREIVEHGKFPPVGSRGYNTRSRGLGYGLRPCETSFAEANAYTHLFAMIETTSGLGDLNAICAVEGISGIFIGPGDLSVALGCTGDLTNAKLIRVVAETIRQAREAGKHAGILATPGPLLDAALDSGCDLCFCGGDLLDLTKAWQQLLGYVRNLKGRQ